MDSFMYPPATATPKGGCFLDGQLEGYCQRDLLTGVLLSRRPSSCASSDLLQNCDLPPPLNSFSPIQKDDTSPSPEPPPHAVSSNKEEQWDDQPAAAEPALNHGDNRDATGLLRALRLSQTRAREAERKAAVASMRNEQMLAKFLEKSLALSAHRRWVKLLETEVSQLRTQRGVQMLELHEQGDEDNLPAAAAAAAFCWAVALCLGITSIGFVLGRRRF